ncbi:MAG: twin-arginine translocase TatA/TatE family subunit [Aeromonas sp.]|nr:twin-arginine translocase TatA/TatE family subunit [Aeromonas sp.]
MHFSITELLLIAFIVLILFGTKKLRNIGGDLGSALRDFKKALHEEPKPTPPASQATDLEKPADAEKLADAQFHAEPQDKRTDTTQDK